MNNRIVMSNTSVVSFQELLDSLGEDTNDPKLYKRVNKLIRDKGLKVLFKNQDTFPLTVFPKQMHSEVAYEVHEKVQVYTFTSIEFHDQLQKNFTTARELFCSFSQIKFSGELYFTVSPTIGANQTIDFLPKGMTPVFVSESAFRQFYCPVVHTTKVDSLYIEKEDFTRFQLKHEIDLANKLPEKRRIMLKAFLEQEGYDTSEEILFSNHNYASRNELWEKLSKFDSKLFPRYQESSMQKLFNGNPYISFDKNKI